MTFISEFFEAKFAPEEAKESKLNEFKDQLFPTWLNNAERRLKSVGGEYFTGNELSYGDLAIFNVLDLLSNAKLMEGNGFGMIHDELIKTMSTCTSLTKLHKRVKNHPRISAYIKNRPSYPF